VTSFVAFVMRSQGNTPKMGDNSCFILHDNDPRHRSVSVKDFLTKDNLTALEYPP